MTIRTRLRSMMRAGTLLAVSAAAVAGAANVPLAPAAFGATAPLQIVTPSLPFGAAGVPYDTTLAAVGGNPLYRWSVSSGVLPTGLSLNKSTGTISGTPITAGTSTFTARVIDHRASTKPHKRDVATESLSIVLWPDTLPAVDSFSASPSSLPVTGGTVSLTASMSDATSCSFSVSPAVGGSPSTVPCGSGSATAQFTIPVNSTTSPVTYTYSLTAVGPVGSTTSNPPQSTTVTAAPVTIAAPIQTTTSTGIYSGPTSSSSELGVMPAGTSPGYICWTTGPVVVYVNVWFEVYWGGITGYYASYYDNSSYPTDSDITSKYGIPECGGTLPTSVIQMTSAVTIFSAPTTASSAFLASCPLAPVRPSIAGPRVL